MLKGAAPISRGVGAASLERLRAATRRQRYHRRLRPRAARRSRCSTICDRTPASPSRSQAYLDEVGYRLVSGYDIADKYALEMPDMLVGAIFGATDHADRHGDFASRRDALRAKVPEARRAEFDQLLEEARFMHRLRDERGMYNDSWGIGSGASRHARSGPPTRRPWRVARRRRSRSTPATTKSSACSTARRQPSVEELQRRQTWRETKTIADAPAFLGAEPQGPPPAEWLPKKAQANARSMHTVIREIFHVPDSQGPKAAASSVAGSRCIRESTKARPESSTARSISIGCNRATC